MRELSNVIEYAFAVGLGDAIHLEDLPPELRGQAPPMGPYDEPEPSLEGQERDRILGALRETRGKKGAAAEKLGMSRTTLWRKMREYGI